MKRKFLFAAVMLCMGLFLVGCGGKEVNSGNDLSDEKEDNGKEEADPKEGNGIILAEGGSLYVVDHSEFVFPDPGEHLYKRVNSDAWGDKLYILIESVKETENGGQVSQFSLNIFDAGSREMTQQAFSLELPEGYTIDSMEAQNSSKLSFRLKNYDEGEEENDILLETDLDGNVTLREDFFPDWEEYPWNPTNTMESSKCVYDNTDGTTILSQWNVEETISRLFWYDKEKHSRRMICELDGYPDALYLDQSQMLYYIGNNNLLRRNLADQTEEVPFSLKEISYSSLSYTALMPGSSGELVLGICGANGDKLDVYTLSGEKPEAAEEIRMAYLHSDGRGNATAIAAEYSLDHQECPIRAELAEGSEEDYKNRM
mgnify:CR=1 FL=1